MSSIIAIDGPSGAGKGTLSKALGNHYNFATLDTGSIYRGVALHIIENFNIDKMAPSDIANAAKYIFQTGEISNYMQRHEIRSPLISQHTYLISPNPQLRALVRQYQIDFANNPPAIVGKNSPRGAIVEGRNIGTAIFPNAAAKIHITASSEAKARRRHAEYTAGPGGI